MMAAGMRWPTSNAEFLTGVFNPLPLASWPVLCGFDGNPSDRNDPRTNWTGHPWAAGCATDDPARNWYFTLATYPADGVGRVNRDKDRLATIYGVLVDDIGKLAPLSRLDSLPPSVLTMTSAGNFQALYLFDQPSTDGAAVHALQSSLIAAGLSDPAAHGPASRYARMPFASNRKQSPPQPCHLVEWHPERRYSIDAIRRGLSLPTVALRQSIVAEVSNDGPCAEWRGPADDDELLEIALRSRSAASAFGEGVTFRQLYEADAEVLGRKWSVVGRAYDASKADMALAQQFAFYTGKDQPRTDRMMRRSALAREKWDRADYLPRTISAACAQQRDVYRGGDHAVVASAPTVASGAAPIDSADPGRHGLNKYDPLQAARALLHRQYKHAECARLMCWQGSFYEWNGANWRELQDADVAFLTYDFLDRLKDSNYLPKKATVSELHHALSNAAYIKSDAAPPCWINDDGTRPPAAEIIACANGLLHLPSRTTTPPTPRFFSLNSLPFPYEPNAPRPVNWLRFLDQVWPNDHEAISTLQEMFGYLLTPDTSQQKIFLLVGPRRSGKGTIGRVLNAVLGLENVASPALGEMSGRFGLQPLVGALAALISDARLGAGPEQKKVAENLLRISGEDRVLVDRKGVKALTLRLGVRFVLMTNELPRIADASGATASRFVILSMSESFLGREDPGLTAKLLPELSGVLAWAVEGWHRLKSRGHFVEPRSSAAAVQELADLGSPISAFVRDECVLAPGSEVEVGKLHSAWTVWSERQGIAHPSDRALFGRDLMAAFVGRVKKARPRSGGERQHVYQGLALRS